MKTDILDTNDGLENLDTSKVTTMEDMFSGCFSLTNLDLSHFDTSNVTNMANMFSFCANISDLCLSNFNTSRVTDMEYMFEDCDNLSSVDLSSFDTNNVAKFDQMFQLCIKLNHLVLGTKSLFSQYAEMGLPEVPSVGTLVPGTDKKVTALYWVSTSGYEQGKQYTSEELMAIKNRDQVTTYDWVSAAPVAEVSTESKAVSRLINIHQPDNTTKTITQTAMIKRQVNTNEDGSIDYGAWSTASWDAYDLPVFAGYSASSKQIPAAVVDGQTQDQVVDIFYEPVEQTITVQYLDKGKVVGIQQLTGYVGETITPNYHVPAGYELAASPQPTVKVDASGKQVIKVNVNHKLVQSTEIRIFTRTINVHQPDGTIKTTNQVAVVRRTVTIDQATGMRTTGSWHTDIWEEYRLPEITGYTPTKSVIPIKVIDANSQNERIDVYYKANK